MDKSSMVRPVAIVTGAARGIGKGCALAYAKAGFNVLINDRTGAEDTALLEKLSGELKALGADTVIFQADVSDLSKHQPMLEAALGRWGRIDSLLNNAGVTVLKRADMLEATPESFDHCININTRAVFFLSQRVANHMLKQGELDGQHRSIIVITSSNVKVLSLPRAEYNISKAASSMVVQLLGLRLANDGIGVYEVRPGIIESEMTRPVKPKYDKYIEEGGVPNQRWGTPADVASTVVTMAEGRLIYTVGQSVTVDGGLSRRHF